MRKASKNLHSMRVKKFSTNEVKKKLKPLPLEFSLPQITNFGAYIIVEVPGDIPDGEGKYRVVI